MAACANATGFVFIWKDHAAVLSAKQTVTLPLKAKSCPRRLATFGSEGGLMVSTILDDMNDVSGEIEIWTSAAAVLAGGSSSIVKSTSGWANALLNFGNTVAA